MGFPGAGADAAAADYGIVGAPLDVTTSGRPGTRFGPQHIRAAAEDFEDYDPETGLCVSDCAVHDAGDVRVGQALGDYLQYLEGVLADHARAGRCPLLLGGEHTVTLAAVRALQPAVLVCLDAHLDLRDTFRGRQVSHATVTRRALDTVDEVVVLGARSGSVAEFERAGEPDVTTVPPGEIGDWEPTVDGRHYLSLDIDVADPGFAPGTGTPEPGGLAPRELDRLVRALAPGAVGFDVVEVNDHDDGQAALLGAKLLRAFVYARAAAEQASVD